MRSIQAFTDDMDELKGKSGVAAMPVVAGTRLTAEAGRLAQRYQVWQLTDGHVITPAAAGTLLLTIPITHTRKLWLYCTPSRSSRGPGAVERAYDALFLRTSPARENSPGSIPLADMEQRTGEYMQRAGVLPTGRYALE